MQNEIIREDLERITAAPLPWKKFAGKTVLVSGGNGFLPAYMIETLLYLNQQSEQRTRVLALVRSQERAASRFACYSEGSGLQIIVGDVCAPLKVSDKIDYIIHAASRASPKYYGKDAVGTLAPNILGTNNLLNLAKEKNAESFLFFSSGEVYGEVNSTQVPTREDAYGYIDPTNLRACYAESKRMGETMCVAWHHQYDIPTKIIRPFHTYGPGMRLDDGRVYADFVADVVNNRDIVMKSDGRARRAFCYLADAVQGFFTVLLKGESAEAYNIGNDRGELSIGELADKLVALFPERKLNVVKQKRARDVSYIESPISRNCPDISKARSLGWEPVTSVEDGFSRTVISFE